jgi:hypothetical protein
VSVIFVRLKANSNSLENVGINKNFRRISSPGAEFFHADRRTESDRHVEAKTRFLQMLCVRLTAIKPSNLPQTPTLPTCSGSTLPADFVACLKYSNKMNKMK